MGPAEEERPLELTAQTLGTEPRSSSSPFHRFGWDHARRIDGRVSRVFYLRSGNPGRGAVEQMLVRAVPGFASLAKDQDWWIVDEYMQDPRSRNDSAWRDPTTPYNLALGASSSCDLLVVTSDEEMLQRVEEVLTRAVSDVPQIEIEATIIEISMDDELRTGVSLMLTRGSEGDPESSLIDNVSVRLAQDLLEGTIGHFSAIHDDSTIAGLFELLRRTGRTEVLSAPKLAVLNGHRAVIDTGAETPFLFPTISPTGIAALSTQFKPTGITMIVTPYVVTPTMIQLEIDVNISVITGSVTTTLDSKTEVENPLISRRGASTVINVPHGQTALLGGLVISGDLDAEDKVPVLGDLPLVGYLFRRDTQSSQKGQVLFFVKPRVLTAGFREGEVFEPESSRRPNAGGGSP